MVLFDGLCLGLFTVVLLGGACLGIFTMVLLFTKAVNGAQYIFNGINERGVGLYLHVSWATDTRNVDRELIIYNGSV